MWLLLTSNALYLMNSDGEYVSKIDISPSKTNPNEQVARIAGMAEWFKGDAPGAMIISMNRPVEPSEAPQPVKKSVPTGTATPSTSSAIPTAAIDIIKEFEGYARELPDGRCTAYADAIHGWKVPTIGYGTTKYPDGRKVQRGDIINRQQANEYLLWHVEDYCKAAMERIPTWGQMNDNQRSAIYSFAYNLGAGFYRGRNFTSITRVCDTPERWGDREWVTAQFVKYRNPGTSAEAGLLRRRRAEAELFLG